MLRPSYETDKIIIIIIIINEYQSTQCINNLNIENNYKLYKHNKCSNDTGPMNVYS